MSPYVITAHNRIVHLFSRRWGLRMGGTCDAMLAIRLMDLAVQQLEDRWAAKFGGRN